MSTSISRIKKVCEWCGKEFLSQKCTTRFCGKRCAQHVYKERKRQERKSTTEAQVQKQLQEKADAEQRISQLDRWYDDNAEAISFGQFYRENYPK